MLQRLLAVCLVLLCTASSVLSQSSADVPQNWHLLSPVKDGIQGISLDSAYIFLKEKEKKSHTVIVAILDSGIDTAHEDLKEILWHNLKEIPNNGIDDDGNGYVDDEYGWNFLGGKDGRNINKASEEKSRVYHRFKSKFATDSLDTTKLNNDEKYEYAMWKRAAIEMNASTTPEEERSVELLDITVKTIKRYDSVLREEIGSAEYTPNLLEKTTLKTHEGKKAKMAYLTLTKMINVDGDEKNTTTIPELEEYVESKKQSLRDRDSMPVDVRAEYVKDNYYNINDKYYGNNNVMGPMPLHGTHVAGIIAAKRNNGIGMDGVADDVKIMVVRVVPDGDEYDKDIALGIFYAVDNGAKVINMSFGKSYSPEKKWVDSAMRYALSKDVLIVHAAGNDAANIDEKQNFPNPYMLTTHTKLPNYITVGASSDKKLTDNNIIADFSNYGANNVDVFSPGVKIYSTLPSSENKYGRLSGTSMATPVVTGLAALIRSYYPQLSAIEVKEAIEKSVDTFPDSSNTYKPGTKDKISFTRLCKSGGIIDAYHAVMMADKMEANILKRKAQEKKSIKQ